MACDDRARIIALRTNDLPAPWTPFPPVPIAAFPPCHPNQPSCAKRTLNNVHHPAPPGAAGAATTRTRTVCDNCDILGRAHANVSRWTALPPPLGIGYMKSEESVFREDNPPWGPPWTTAANPPFQLGAHHLGKLCTACEDNEIAAFHERVVSGRARQPRTPAAVQAARVREARTCKCEKRLAKRMCFDDRMEVLFDIERDSGRNAGRNGVNFLHWLWFNPATGRAEQANTPARQAVLSAFRGWHPASPCFQNACRCGHMVLKANHVVLNNRTPTPVAMCTACDGILIDINHARVTGWAANGRQRRQRVAGRERNLKLGRPVPNSN